MTSDSRKTEMEQQNQYTLYPISPFKSRENIKHLSLIHKLCFVLAVEDNQQNMLLL